jgi:hypothetical protein
MLEPKMISDADLGKVFQAAVNTPAGRAVFEHLEHLYGARSVCFDNANREYYNNGARSVVDYIKKQLNKKGA